LARKQKSLLAGKKISSSHTTYNSVAAEVIKILKTHEEVKKIVLGPIKKARSSSIKRLTVKEDKGQAKVMCRDSGSIQELYIIGVDVIVLERLLDKYILK